MHVDASGPLATGPGCNVELGSWNAPLVIENSYVSSDLWLLSQSSKLSMCECESAISLLTLNMFYLLVLQWIWAERCSFVMGPLPAHHNSDGKGQRASNDERHASDDSGDLSGTFTMQKRAIILFRSIGDHARDVRCGRADPRRQPALGLPCRLPGDRLLVRPLPP